MNYTVYGNLVPPKKLRIGNFLSKYYAHAYGFDSEQPPSLTAVPHTGGYEDFGLMAVVEKKSVAKDKQTALNTEKGVLLGTMRMGFGHCRMAIALASAAKHAGFIPYWFDMLSFPDTTAGKTIRSLEHWYNLGSRISQHSKLFETLFWEKITSVSAQTLSASLKNAAMADIYAALFRDIPANMSVLSTHPWVGQGAVRAGLQNIITVVPDNFPLAFHIVEGTTHAVQSPSSFMGYRTLFAMGDKGFGIQNCMPPGDIFEAGHFVDHEIVSNIEYDCDLRRKRIKDGKPRRFLLSMGGAGAQVMKFADIARKGKGAIEAGKAVLFINMGDHKGRWALLEQELRSSGIKWTFHTDWQQTRNFINEVREGDVTGVHIFLHDDFYAAVYATNLLMRVCDVLITKPSELSFYPVPKLFIHRVGRHEAWGAIRSSECGDGTIETSSPSGLYRTLDVLTTDTDLLDLYCTHIIKNAKTGMYDGAYNIIKHIRHGRQNPHNMLQ
ncbi:hypothetical protein H0R92_00090 [Treponema sp. OMZ 840]|uniref:DUF6938 domain-containing protein n=1 Tax=Treponema sp. OMZ 840 TaxID=244313 RepID=UPI003D8E4BE7